MENSNKLIAEFMGFPTHTDAVDDRTIAYYVGESIMHTDNTENDNDYDVFHPDDMQFHTSWDWLMPVVEEIESDERYDVDILQYGTRIIERTKTESIEIVNNIANISFDKKINHTYQAVVEFIKNQNN